MVFFAVYRFARRSRETANVIFVRKLLDYRSETSWHGRVVTLLTNKARPSNERGTFGGTTAGAKNGRKLTKTYTPSVSFVKRGRRQIARRRKLNTVRNVRKSVVRGSVTRRLI